MYSQLFTSSFVLVSICAKKLFDPNVEPEAFVESFNSCKISQESCLSSFSTVLISALQSVTADKAM